MGKNRYGFKSACRRTSKHLYKLGDIVIVRASTFLGVGPYSAQVVGYHPQGYIVLEQAGASEPNFGPGDEFEIDFDQYILIGPPLNGKLVRAA